MRQKFQRSKPKMLRLRILCRFTDEEIYSWTCCHDEQRTGELELDFNENSSTKHG